MIKNLPQFNRLIFSFGSFSASRDVTLESMMNELIANIFHFREKNKKQNRKTENKYFWERIKVA